MVKHRSHSIEFKRQVAQEFLAGETLHGLAKRHDVSRNLVRVWVEKYEAGAFDEDARAADLIQEYEARIAALERLVGKQALELEFLKGALRQGRPPRSAPMSVITGWSGPFGADNDQAAVLTGGRAFSSSNWLGLRYPSAECRRRSLYFSMKRGRCSATSSWVSKAIG